MLPHNTHRGWGLHPTCVEAGVCIGHRQGAYTCDPGHCPRKETQQNSNRTGWPVHGANPLPPPFNNCRLSSGTGTGKSEAWAGLDAFSPTLCPPHRPTHSRPLPPYTVPGHHCHRPPLREVGPGALPGLHTCPHSGTGLLSGDGRTQNK